MRNPDPFLRDVDFHFSSYAKIGHGQSDEEKYILEHAPAMGRFLDIGAYDGVTFSNTRALALKGWSGVYVEPCKKALVKLVQNTDDFNRFQVAPYAVGSFSGKATFHSCNEMVGSLIEPTRWKNEFDWTTYEVDVVIPLQLLNRYGTKFDLVSIDVEGSNYEVFERMPWYDIDATVIIIEHDRQFRNIQRRLKGYATVYGNKENIVLVKK